MKNLLRSRIPAPAPFWAPEQDSRRGKEDFPEHLDADKRRLYTVTEVADLFAVSAKTIYRLVEEGSISSRRVGLGRGAVRFMASDLDEFLRRSKIEFARIEVREISL